MRKTRWRSVAWAVLCLTAQFAVHSGAETIPSLRNAPRLTRAEGELSIRGPLQSQVQGVIRHWLLVAPERNPAMLQMFEDRDQPPYRDLLPWSGEFAGKYLTACAQMWALTHDPELRAHTEQFVSKLVKLQDADGYLGPFPKAHRLTGTAPHRGSMPTWDAWGHYHVMLGLLLWHEQTGHAGALQCAERIGDLLCTRFLGTGQRVFDMGSPDQNQAVIHGLALLYEKTGRQPFLDLATQIVAEFEITGAGDYLRTALNGAEFYATPKPRWESLHAILALIELYRITGKEDYRRGFEQIWWSIAKLDRHNNGGFSSGEQAVGNPYNPAPIETCCTIAWLAMSLEMLRTTEDPIVADEMELTTFNSVIGMHAPDGAWSTYNTPMDGRRIPNTRDISFQIRPGSEQLNCCSVNAARGFGILSEWAVMRQTGGADGAENLAINWYGPSTFSTKVRNRSVTFEQVTDYPRTGRVILKVAPQEPLVFGLALRIPHWSAQTSIVVNGEKSSPQAGTYLFLSREWKKGDEIVIDLDMRLRAWVGERECAGKVALFHGPLLLAYEPVSSATIEPIDLEALRVEPSSERSANAAPVAVDLTTGSGKSMYLRDFGTAGQEGRSYISWLPVKSGKPLPFLRRNPTRTVVVAAP